MGEISDAVRRCIEDDVFLQEALARGIATYREVARWLQENRGVEGEVSSVAAAVQRHAPEEGSEAMARAWEALDGARVDRQAGLGAASFPLSEKSFRGLRRLLDLVDPSRGASFRVLHDDGSMTLILDGSHLLEAEETIGDEIDATVDDLVEVRIVPEDEDQLPASVLTLALGCLAVNGVEARFSQAGPRFHSIFVEEEDGREAFGLLGDLTSR